MTTPAPTTALERMTLRDPSPPSADNPSPRPPLSPQRSATQCHGRAARGGDTPWCMQQYPATALACKPLRRLRRAPGPRTASTNSSEAPSHSPWAHLPASQSQSQRPLQPTPAHRQPQRRFADAAVQRGSSGSFPEPTIQYSTPGLGKDRRAFTTNAGIGPMAERLGWQCASQMRATLT